jgi:integrase
MARHQRGSLRKEPRKRGDVWVLRFYKTRPEDGKRVEDSLVVGPLSKFKSESAAWAEVERQQLMLPVNNPTTPTSVGKVTFRELASHYLAHELPKRAATTQALHRHIIDHYLDERWGTRIALSIRPLEIEQWLDSLRDERKLANPTRAKIRQLMSRIYQHSQKHELVPRAESSNPLNWVTCATQSAHEAMILSPGEVFALVQDFPLKQRTMTFLAAGTGLRISEILGLKWEHVDFERQRIVKQTWIDEFGVGKPKTQASGKPVPLAPLLADIMGEWKKETTYGADNDWVFASPQMKGKQPVTGGIMAQRWLRPAAERLGIIEPGDPRRFGWHNLRHSLASFLVVQAKVDPKTAQSILRHANSSTTMDLYVHANVDAKLAAQQQMMEALLHGASATVN